jgi:hypothetical protein
MMLPLNRRNPYRAAWSLVLLIAIVLTNTSSHGGVARIAAPVMPRSEQAFDRRAELRKVLLVVEHRTKDGKVLEKMREKLCAMSDRELRLAASLCKQIARDDDSAGSDIAFSIVMALVVLS